MRSRVVVLALVLSGGAIASITARGEETAAPRLAFATDAALASFLAPRRVSGATPMTRADASGGSLAWIERPRTDGAEVCVLDPTGDGEVARTPLPRAMSVHASRDGRVLVCVRADRSVVRVTGAGGLASVVSFAADRVVALSPSGRFALLEKNDHPQLWDLAAESPVHLRELACECFSFSRTAFSPDESLVALCDPEPVLLRTDTGAVVTDLAPGDVGRATAVAFTPAGLLVTGHPRHVATWRPGLSGVERLATLALPIQESIHFLAVAPDGRHVVARTDGWAGAIGLDATGRLEETWLLPPLRWVALATTHAVACELDAGHVAVRRHPIGPVRVGDDTVLLAHPDPLAAGPSFAWLSARVDWRGGVTGVSTVAYAYVEVVNAGETPVEGLTGTIAFDPPIAPPSRVHVGRVPAREVVRRTVIVERPATFDRGDALAELRFEDPGLHAPAPVAWHHLPRRGDDARALDALAAEVHSASIAILRELVHDPLFAPALFRKSPDEVGFTASSDGRAVHYQNPFAFSPRALDLNRQVMLASCAEDVLRDGELMLFWFIPHENVHAARARTGVHAWGWFEELAANTVQPRLTERVLERLGAPYDAATFRRVYDRYVARLGAKVRREDAAAIDAFIASGGAKDPFARSPRDVFEQDVPLYVYFGARVNQRALAEGSSLEELAARWLVKK